MKSIQNLYKEIIYDAKLQMSLAQSVRDSQLSRFLRDNGCDAAESEFLSYVKAMLSSDSEIEDAELELVAGGVSLHQCIYSLSLGSIGCDYTVMAGEDGIPRFYPIPVKAEDTPNT